MLTLCIPVPPNGQFLNQWDYALSNFTPDQLCLIGDLDPGSTRSSFFADAGSLTSAEDCPTSKPLIVFSPKAGNFVSGTVSLADFVHPADATYLFGPDTAHLSSDELGDRVPDSVVYIPTDTQFEMYSWMAFVVVMWDRRMKADG